MNKDTDAMSYEFFIRRVYNCERGNRNGADSSFMSNAISMEQGESYARHLGTYQKQFEKVKKYVFKALAKLTTMKPYNEEDFFFQDLYFRMSNVNSTEELMNIINLALDKMNEFKNQET